MNELLFPFERMLADIAPAAAVRSIESGGSPLAMWAVFVESGFLDALLSEDAGGFGLSLTDVQPLWQVLGRHAVPLPVGETMIARTLLAAASLAAPAGPIAIAVAAPSGETLVPFGLVADHILVEADGRLHLVEIAEEHRSATGVPCSLASRIDLQNISGSGFAGAPMGGLRSLAAILRAALIAGAAERITQMTAAYANERIQFGKPIGRQQALQQQMAVMAEEMVAARIASQIGCAGAFPPGLVAAATAKSVASRAATRVAATAHAVYGAIGISEEHDLQLYTRRLHEWRLADGSESYWNRLLGAARLTDAGRSVDFVRARLAAEPSH